jgi:hypothetical protein
MKQLAPKAGANKTCGTTSLRLEPRGILEGCCATRNRRAIAAAFLEALGDLGEKSLPQGVGACAALAVCRGRCAEILHPTRVPVRAAQSRRRFLTEFSSRRIGLRFHHFGEFASPLRWRVSKACWPIELRRVTLPQSMLANGKWANLDIGNVSRALPLRRQGRSFTQMMSEAVEVPFNDARFCERLPHVFP